MKWINHQIVTGVAVYALTDNLLLTAYSMAGAILPDKIEGNPKNKGKAAYWAWRKMHRGLSHWFVLYLLGMGLIREFNQTNKLAQDLWDINTIAFYIFLGALFHIAEDAICGKVPFITPSQKIGIRLFKVGSVSEYLFSLAIILLCYAGKTAL